VETLYWGVFITVKNITNAKKLPEIQSITLFLLKMTYRKSLAEFLIGDMSLILKLIVES